METQNEIVFYSHIKEGKYNCFSNFFPCKFCDNITEYNCSEQYLMKKKQELFDNNNKEVSNQIMNETNPSVIKNLGRNIKNFNEKKWNENKFKIMCDGLYLKFSQNDDLKKILVDTQKKKIYEASPYDRIWGTGYNKIDTLNKIQSNHLDELGENLLGLALEKTRESLIN
jgi:hypothetical protein